VRHHHILPSNILFLREPERKLTNITGSNAAVFWYTHGHTAYSRTKPSHRIYCHFNVISVQIVRNIVEMYYLWQKFILQRLTNNFIRTQKDPGIMLMILTFKKEFLLHSTKRHAVDRKKCARIFNC
jgi:hypothetical protein